MPVAHDLPEGADLLRLVLRIHRQVGALPVAEHAEALEVGALQRDLLGGELAAGGAERRRIEFVPRTTVLLLDRELDRQAMAVPARHVGRVVAIEAARLDDDVLEDLVDRMADVDRAIGIRRPVVQHEARPAAGDVAAARHRCPRSCQRCEHLRLALREIGLHREVGPRKIDRLLVVGHCVFLSSCAPPSGGEDAARVARVAVHLRDQRIEAVELRLVADLLRRIRPRARDRTGRRRNRTRAPLEQRLDAADRGSRAEARDAAMRGRAPTPCTRTAKMPPSGTRAALEPQVRRRVAERRARAARPSRPARASSSGRPSRPAARRARHAPAPRARRCC